MKVRLRLTGRSDREVTEWITNGLAILVVFFVLAMFLFAAAGVDN